jgi:hypothetical protein
MSQKTFLILEQGAGGGCDYTIDCNKTWQFVRAFSIEGARYNYVHHKVRQETGPDPSPAVIVEAIEGLKELLETVTIIEVADKQEFSGPKLFSDMEDKARAAEDDRLQAKYGG